MVPLAMNSDGVKAALQSDGPSTGQGQRKAPKQGYMSSMAELRGGMTAVQWEHAAQQRLKLKQDLEQQVWRPYVWAT